MSIPEIYSVIPTVIESSGRGERAYDIYSMLLKERIIFVGTQITDQSANLIVAQLLFLDHVDQEREIQMFINSPGGNAYAGLGIYDTMMQVHAPIRTVAVGLTASFGTILLAAGTQGHRFALANATIHMHQPLGGAEGQASDIQIHARQILNLKSRVEGILSHHTGQEGERIRHDLDRDIFLTPEDAVEYGLIDGVLAPRAANGTNGEKSLAAAAR